MPLVELCPKTNWIKITVNVPFPDSRLRKKLIVFRILLICLGWVLQLKFTSRTDSYAYIKFIYSEKATKFCEIFWLQYIQSKVMWRFRKILWPSQNILTLQELSFSYILQKYLHGFGLSGLAVKNLGFWHYASVLAFPNYRRKAFKLDIIPRS